MNDVEGMRVAILVDDGFELVEMVKPRQVLEDAGAETKVVALGPKVRAWTVDQWSESFQVDVPLITVDPGNFDALLLPGGVINSINLRIIPRAVAFAKYFFETRKPIAVISHAPWMVIEAGAASGRRITASPSLKTDLLNAGAEWVNKDVVVDANLISGSGSRPEGIAWFGRDMLRRFAFWRIYPLLAA